MSARSVMALSKVFLCAEVPVDARHPDVEMLAQHRHTQIVQRHLFGEFECTVDDFVPRSGWSIAWLSAVVAIVSSERGPDHLTPLGRR